MNVQVYGSLPVTRNMPYHTASVPSQSQPRNMTGIYLGLEGNQRPPKPKSCVPPLARSRGYSKSRTPTEEQRYRKVELLRIKEDKRGFAGNPVKSHQQPPSGTWSSSHGTNTSPASRPMSSAHNASISTPGYHSPGLALSEPSSTFIRRWGPGRFTNHLDDQLRASSRHYTSVVNSGLTRSEKLTGFLKGTQSLHNEADLVRARDVVISDDVDLVGLEECFRKVCTGNIEMLYSLLPNKKTKRPRENTGFTVRSYRNPKQAEILADFNVDSVKPFIRPKTVPIRRPLVPQPYFFLHHATHPGAASIAAHHQRYLPPDTTLENTGNYFQSTSKILAAPGAGVLSRSLQQRIQSPAVLSIDPRPRTEPTGTSVTPPPPVLSLPGVHIGGKGLQSGESTSRTTAKDSEESGRSPRQGEGRGLHVTVDIKQPSETVEIKNISNSTLEADLRLPPEGGNDDNNSISSDTLSDPAPFLSMEKSESQTGVPVTEVQLPPEEPCSTTEDSKPRPKLTASNSGADIMLGLETEEGQCAEVEIDTADQDELMPEAEAPKGRVRKASITEKVIKSKASEALAAMIKEEAELRQKEFEKLLDEHAELVQEISRTPSSENLIQGERDH